METPLPSPYPPGQKETAWGAALRKWAEGMEVKPPPPPQELEWWRPNPDPSVADLSRLYVDHESGLTLIRDRARPKQRPPDGEWFVWLLKPGRGFGKTRTGGEYIDREVRAGRSGPQVLIAGRTPSDVHDYSLNGEGGLLRHHPDIKLTARKLVWPNGVVGLIRSGANPEEFRGYSGGLAWLDEFAAWDYPTECWENLIFGMREGNPRIVITTTPRPIQQLKDIIAMKGVVVVGGSSHENAPNLSSRYVINVLDPKRGTRLGRQEIEGEILEDTPGALWKLADIERTRCHSSDLPELERIVVGVDPQGTKSDPDDDRTASDGSRKGRHETGVVVAAKGRNGRGYILADESLNGTPGEWGNRAVSAFDRWKADRIVGEINYGGEMVEHVIRTIRPNAPFSTVRASRGKVRRAEPIATLYERGMVSHVGSFPGLEDEQCSYTADTDESPNRLDALVWAMTELFPNEAPVRVVDLTW